MWRYRNLTSCVLAALTLSNAPSAMATTLLEAVKLGLENNLSLRASDKGVEENDEIAMEWFEKAAENGNEKALKITGRRRK